MAQEYTPEQPGTLQKNPLFHVNRIDSFRTLVGLFTKNFPMESREYVLNEFTKLDEYLGNMRKGDSIITPHSFDKYEDFRKKVKAKATELKTSIQIDTSPQSAPVKTGYILYRFA